MAEMCLEEPEVRHEDLQAAMREMVTVEIGHFGTMSTVPQDTQATCATSWTRGRRHRGRRRAARSVRAVSASRGGGVGKAAMTPPEVTGDMVIACMTRVPASGASSGDHGGGGPSAS
mgnify:CR=1 FL=1